MDTRFQPNTRTASSHARSYSPSGIVALPGVQRRRTASSIDSTWMPIEVAPASRNAAITGRSAGGSTCTWMGRPGTAPRTARTQRARCRAPRSGPAVVPVVMTICRIPSSRTAACATSASWAGVFAAIVVPARSDSSIVQNLHRWSSPYLMQICTTVVASTSLPCNSAICQYGTPSDVVRS